jgi:hypothetical protein
MTFGDFDQATALAQRVAEDPLWRDRAMRVMLIASVLSHGHVDESSNLNIHLSDLSRRDPHVERVATASLWLNGILGRITVRQIDSCAAGADPFASVLQPLLRQALNYAETVAADEGESSGSRDHASHYRDVLSAVLGSTTVQTHSRNLPVSGGSNDWVARDKELLELRRAA